MLGLLIGSALAAMRVTGVPFEIRREIKQQNMNGPLEAKRFTTKSVKRFASRTVYAGERPTVAVEITGYSSERRQTDSTPWTTGSGLRVRTDRLAVSCDLLPLMPYGSKVILNGQPYVVADTMNLRWTRRVDRWFPSRGAALQHGIKRGTLVLIKKANDKTRCQRRK